MKLHPKSKVTPAGNDIDTVRRGKKCLKGRAFHLLLEAQQYWDNMEGYRQERERNKRYTYGDQWDDFITVDGCRMTEDTYIRKMGNVPLKNNLIRRLVRNVNGVYRSQSKEPVCNARDRDEQRQSETMTTVLQYNMQLNRMSEVYARTMEEYMIGALVVHRKWFGWRNDKLDCWTDYVAPNRFFIDTNMRDFRGWDVTCLGELHDIPFGELTAKFAENADDYQKLRDIYQAAHSLRGMSMYRAKFGKNNHDTLDFLYCPDESLCRVIELWRKEQKPRYRCHDYNTGEIFKVDIEDYEDVVESENERRKAQGRSAGMSEEDIPLIEAEWFIDSYWYFYYLTPFGDILSEGETPYAHKSHPYVFKAYPYIDGEIHSFVADVIDQQRYTNRLITMYDWIMRASAKGVLLIPDESVPEGMSVEDFADSWTRFNGVILYHAKPGVPMPTQVSNNSTNIGISELLNVQLKFFEDISGVHGALQGRNGTTGTSGTLYAQQTQNATTSLLDLLDSFSQFVIDAAYKDVKNIQQFYDQKRVFNIAGKSATLVEYDPEKIADIEFDLSIAENTSTPVYRQLANDYLMQFWQSGQITLQQLLQVGDFAFADELLQTVNAQQEQMQQGMTPEGIPPELQQQVQQGANPQAVNQLYNALQP